MHSEETLGTRFKYSNTIWAEKIQIFFLFLPRILDTNEINTEVEYCELHSYNESFIQDLCEVVKYQSCLGGSHFNQGN